jgi:hypothetical protein
LVREGAVDVEPNLSVFLGEERLGRLMPDGAGRWRVADDE